MKKKITKITYTKPEEFFKQRNAKDYASQSGTFQDICPKCEVPFKRDYVNGKRRTIHCSRKCAMSGKSLLRKERDPDSLTDKFRRVKYPAVCEMCAGNFYSPKKYGKLNKFCSNACSNSRLRKHNYIDGSVSFYCATCKIKFTVPKNNKSQYPKTCSEACLRTLMTEGARAYHKEKRDLEIRKQAQSFYLNKFILIGIGILLLMLVVHIYLIHWYKSRGAL